jgi:hypothetical protein
MGFSSENLESIAFRRIFAPKKKKLRGSELKSEELSSSPGINLRKLQQGCFPFILKVRPSIKDALLIERGLSQ